ncbi:hypothetical protein OEZ85_007193 [Tetradesmus obliquus]|uniref:Uncharacterized protein n=1 Tax=Tetradesmus obliquus TaxID=3088 RepID=A0ABY8TWU3_TETOB|nr:hypothetical protein OEZ85_007193 [Tetradesmus obliquus]
MAESKALAQYRHQVEAWGWQVEQRDGAAGAAAAADAAAAAGSLNSSALLKQVPVVADVQLGTFDLQLYLHQLLETGGLASQPPPGVVRVLKSKACRSAIMFGKLLSRQQCVDLVQQLGQTELCFCCAHGRPTTVPLVDLVGKLMFDIRYDDKDGITKDDIRQQFNMPACGSTKLLTKLAPGAVLACPFTSNDNIYHGAMSIVSGAMKLTEDNASGNYLGFDVIPKLMPISAGSKPASSKPAAYTATLQANIPSKDIACGQKDCAGKPAAFCKVCGGNAAVQAACDARKECAAFDMEGSDCGYLKAAKGPFKKPAKGFTSYAKA